jgi:V/A-type H+-transporting ATPase subunit E
MSQPDKKLDKFSSSVLRDAQAQREKILAEIEEYRRSEMEKAEEEILHESYVMIQSEIAAIKNRQSKTISLAELDGRRKFLRQREEITQRVFRETADKILAYTRTPEYTDRLCGDAAKSCGNIPEGNVIIQLRPDDMAAAPRISKAAGRHVTVEENPSIELGGYILINSDKGVIIDETLDSKLSSQKDWFAESSGLGMGL